MSFADENRIVQDRWVEPETRSKTAATVFRWVSETCPVPSDGLRDGAGLSDSRRCSDIPESSRPAPRISGPCGGTGSAPARYSLDLRILTQGSALTVLATFLMKPLKLSNP